jgi:hypothetical protein
MKFVITFGQKYRFQDHPQGGHPDGWFEVTAESEAAAREKVFAVLGQTWAFIYDENEFDQTFYPKGKIGEIE